MEEKTSEFPNTRLETLVFETTDIDKYYDIQKEVGVRFMTPYIERYENYDFIQTIPSSISGTSFGFIQWKKNKGQYRDGVIDACEVNCTKDNEDFTENIKELDHLSIRVHSEDRDNAIIEFMLLTNYNFDQAIYIERYNSITNVLRRDKAIFAMVFTSGITPYKVNTDNGPTERFIHSYGTRTHHLAFNTLNIEKVYEKLVDSGMEFLLELIGNREEGMKQTFTKPSQKTYIINEYLYRYDGFDGFFTKSNVTKLTNATDRQ